ncbi:methyltransferase [Stieleria mannarensis]|uniref:methyltransferase n=1 Tax=Stieleria mannarensis TaxID=2755585 RepID=UPI0016045E60
MSRVASSGGPTPDRSSVDSDWTRLCRGFLRCHRSPLNVACHLVTTPLGLFGAYSLLAWTSPIAAALVAMLHIAVVVASTPAGVACLHAIAVGLIAAAAAWLSLSLWWSVAAITVGYIGQDLAHWLTAEPTFQSTYKDSRRWWQRFIEHSLLLLPVLIVIAGRWRQSPFRLLVARKAVLKTKLTDGQDKADFDAILNWVCGQQVDVSQSTHWWQSDLSGAGGASFRRLAESPQLMSMIRSFHGSGYDVRPVLGMNELYVTGPPKTTSSDTVFYMGHVDGPWAIFPGARLYRCMLALNQNLEVTTHYPMSNPEYTVPESHRLQHGDAVVFDFNRELHYITRSADPRQSEPRVNLKLHFVASPHSLRWYGSLLARLTTWYDIRARDLFLKTIRPEGMWPAIKARWVLAWTRLFEQTVRFVGWTNLAYVTIALLISAVVGEAAVFLAATSFVHYAIYIGTLQERTPVSFGTFRRDAMFFKTVSMSLLLALYAMHFDRDFGALTLVIGGFALAGYAAQVLGMRRTLFSAELGFDPPERIKRFPFGTIPHPMIIGAMTGIGGMALSEGFRDHYGWLIAGHLVCYAIVLVHEIWHTRRRVIAVENLHLQGRNAGAEVSSTDTK